MVSWSGETDSSLNPPGDGEAVDKEEATAGEAMRKMGVGGGGGGGVTEQARAIT